MVKPRSAQMVWADMGPPDDADSHIVRNCVLPAQIAPRSIFPGTTTNALFSCMLVLRLQKADRFPQWYVRRSEFRERRLPATVPGSSKLPHRGRHRPPPANADRA